MPSLHSGTTFQCCFPRSPVAAAPTEGRSSGAVGDWSALLCRLTRCWPPTAPGGRSPAAAFLHTNRPAGGCRADQIADGRHRTTARQRWRRRRRALLDQSVASAAGRPRRCRPPVDSRDQRASSMTWCVIPRPPTDVPRLPTGPRDAAPRRPEATGHRPGRRSVTAMYHGYLSWQPAAMINCRRSLMQPRCRLNWSGRQQGRASFRRQSQGTITSAWRAYIQIGFLGSVLAAFFSARN